MLSDEIKKHNKEVKSKTDFSRTSNKISNAILKHMKENGSRIRMMPTPRYGTT